MKYAFLFSQASLESASGSASAFHLQAGAWVLTVGRSYSADKQGLSDAKLGWLFFPEVQGGKGKANDVFGPVYGWLVSKDAPKRSSIL